jgi:hypothetical protein
MLLVLSFKRVVNCVLFLWLHFSILVMSHQNEDHKDQASPSLLWFGLAQSGIDGHTALLQATTKHANCKSVVTVSQAF